MTAKEHVAQALEEFAEKKAYGFRPPSDSNNPWVEKFAGTPFYDEAKDLCADSAQRRLEDAQREAVRSARFAAESHLRVEGATLEAKLAAFKADTEDVPEEDTLRKLSSARMGEAGCPWDMMFEGTPFYSDALHYCAKEAQLRAQDNMDWDNASWRETERAKRMLDAKLAAWKYEQETGREFTGLQANVNITLTEGGEQLGPVKQANLSAMAMNAGRNLMALGARNPAAGNAILGAGIGAVSGAGAAGPGHRLRGMVRGGLLGASFAGGGTALAQRMRATGGTTAAAMPKLLSHNPIPDAYNMTGGKLASALMGKEARIFGASMPRELSESALSYDRRQRLFEDYVDRKRKEAPTPMSTALTTSGGIGAGLGALTGLAAGKGLTHGLAGAAIGGLAGMGAGALMRASDAAKIRRAQEVHGNPDAISSELDRQIVRQVRRKQMARRFDESRRHHELLQAIERRNPGQGNGVYGPYNRY